MAGDGYYPEYYLRKRKRDRAYGIATQIIVALLVFGGLGVVAALLAFQYFGPRKSQAGVTPEMAVDRQELSTAQKLAQAATEHDPAPVPAEQKLVDLSSLSYADSMPGTAVSIQGLPGGTGAAGGAEVEAEDLTEPASASDALEPAPAEPRETSPVRTEKSEPVAPEAKTDKKSDSKKVVEKKQEPKVAEKPKPEAKPAPVDKPAPEPAAAPERTVYRVYAGSAGDKAGADELKARLSGLGYAGTVIKSGPDYLVLVDTVEDFDKASALSSDLQGRGFSSFTSPSRFPFVRRPGPG